eukprot:2371561-Amphidinium_carterae.2
MARLQARTAPSSTQSVVTSDVRSNNKRCAIFNPQYRCDCCENCSQKTDTRHINVLGCQSFSHGVGSQGSLEGRPWKCMEVGVA